MSLRVLAFTVVAVISAWFNGQIVAAQRFPVKFSAFTPKGWQLFDEVRQYTPENLYEQINGRASFFLAYDMIRMTHVSYVKSDDIAKFINLSI